MPVPVLVVNILFRAKRSADEFAHHLDVFKHPTLRVGVGMVAVEYPDVCADPPATRNFDRCNLASFAPLGVVTSTKTAGDMRLAASGFFTEQSIGPPTD
jgi:hypothetical protein